MPELVLSPSAEQGYYLFVRPLRPGTHTIRWIASGCTPGNSQDITYHLMVLGGGPRTIKQAGQQRSVAHYVPNNRINADCQLRCASLAAGYADVRPRERYRERHG
ncbi:MAG: hypothetical protein ACREYE_13335 [Gammaproteobacteria bacterium]